MKLHTIQPEAAAALRATPSLAGLVVLEDNGNVEAAAEAQLRTAGTVLIVTIPEDGEASDHGPRACVLDVRIAVEIHQNPKRNAQLDSPRNIAADLTDVALALVFQPNQFGQSGFRVDGFSIIRDEPGLRSYAVTFTRKVTLTP